jgi:Lon protease-like protein
MLDELLEGDRWLAVLGAFPLPEETRISPAGLRVHTLGMVTAAQRHEDGTCTLLLEGICRVQVLECLHNRVFPQIRIRDCENGACSEACLCAMRREVLDLLLAMQADGMPLPPMIPDALKGIRSPETFIDHAIVALVEPMAMKESMLALPDPSRRFAFLIRSLQRQRNRFQFLNLWVPSMDRERIRNN